MRPWIRVRRTEYLISAMQPPPEPRRSYINPHHQRFPVSYKNQHLSAIKPPSTSQAILYKNAAIVVADADVMRHAPRDRRRKRSSVRGGCGQPSTVPVQDRMSSDALLRTMLQNTYWVEDAHVRYGGRGRTTGPLPMVVSACAQIPMLGSTTTAGVPGGASIPTKPTPAARACQRPPMPPANPPANATTMDGLKP